MSITNLLKNACVFAFCTFLATQGYTYFFHSKDGKKTLARQGSSVKKAVNAAKKAMDYAGVAPEPEPEPEPDMLKEINKRFESAYKWSLNHKFLLSLISVIAIYAAYKKNIIQLNF